jgi:hypothetical protein
MGERTYDPAFIEWWRNRAALSAFAIDYAAQAWEEAVRQVKADCSAMHGEETEIRNGLLEEFEALVNAVSNTPARHAGTSMIHCPQISQEHISRCRELIKKVKGE